ncbi:MAG: DNA polymerase III subunit delta [Clostridiales bacterium]|nr:DNA polymerase III subunit delta [Clostridiales bacterium]
MQSIIGDINSGQLKNVYLLYGPEAYLRKQYRDKIRAASKDPEDTMNYHYFEGKDVNVGQVIDLAQTLPFFSEIRLIVIENSGLFKQAADQMADYIKEIPETTRFIFVEEEADKRGRLFKAIKDTGRAVEFPIQDENTLKKWIRMLAKQEKKDIEEQAVHTFLEKTGSDMENIRREFEKLVCYCLNASVITQKDVEAICTTRVSNRIFDMVNAIADKKQKLALSYYEDLLELKEPPMRILYLIGRQFNQLLSIKELQGKHNGSKIIAEKVGLQPFVVNKYMIQADKFSTLALRDALEACVRADEDVKTGKLVDRMSVELIIVRYSA